MNAIKYKNNRKYKIEDKVKDEVEDNVAMKFEVL